MYEGNKRDELNLRNIIDWAITNIGTSDMVREAKWIVIAYNATFWEQNFKGKSLCFHGSEKRIATIIRVTRIGELETTLAITATKTPAASYC
jgi:hypothetical protein